MNEFYQEHTAEDLSQRSLPGRAGFGDAGISGSPGKKLQEATGEVINLGTRIPIKGYEDIVRARQTGRFIAQKLGFSTNKATIVATAISELARNVILYAKTGEISISTTNSGSLLALLITAVDEGPGIPNIQRAMTSGYSTSGGLGVGLSGLRNIADNFEIRSTEGKGTTAIVTILLR